MSEQYVKPPHCGHGHGPLREIPVPEGFGWRCPACFPAMFIAELDRLSNGVLAFAGWLEDQDDGFLATLSDNYPHKQTFHKSARTVIEAAEEWLRYNAQDGGT